MIVKQHTAKRGGKVYWSAKGENEQENNWLSLDGSGWKVGKFGGVYLAYSPEAIEKTRIIWNAKAQESEEQHEEMEDNTEVKGSESMDYANMVVGELRKLAGEKAKEEGLPTTEVKTQWSKAELVKYLETGEKPVKEVNMDDIGKQLAQLIGQLGGGKGAVDEELVKELIQEELKKNINRIEVLASNGQVIPVGIQHFMFECIFRVASIQDIDQVTKEAIARPLDMMLVGPAGSGKTHVCKAIAVALGIPYKTISVGGQTTKSDLIGYMDAHGKYVETELYRAYKFGGVFLMDEMDAGNANTLTILNAMLANGSYTFPNGEAVARHADFICIGAANTFGRGADRMYVGRNEQDAAGRDRFVYVNFDYDEALERHICGAIPKAGASSKYKIGGATCTTDEWLDRVQAYRHAAQELKERIVISPRASQKGSMLLLAGFGVAQVEDMVIWKGIDKGLIEKIKGKAAL